MGCRNCYSKYEEKLASIFGRYGFLVAKYPGIILTGCVLMNCLLGIGLVRVNSETDLEILYTPKDSKASKDRATFKSLFADKSAENFYSKSVTDLPLYADVIVKANDGSNILTAANLAKVKNMYDDIRTNIKVKNDSGHELAFVDVCALRNGNCVIQGDVAFSAEFQSMMLANNITYPIFSGSLLNLVFGGKQLLNGKLKSASMMRLVFYLRENTASRKTLSSLWEKEFLNQMSSNSYESLQFVYSTSDSLNAELNDNTAGDIVFFSLTFTLMITYACFATAGGDSVSNRQNLGFAGVLAAVLAILGSFGLVSLIGIEFVNIVGVMPFLVIGIGIDDMFILMSGLADSPASGTIEEKLRHTMKTSGVAITITSITDLLAFCIGASSVFISVRNFCLYTGVAVIFCYINQLTFFLPCMVINERRVKGNRHFGSCLPIPSRRQLSQDPEFSKKDKKCYFYCCTGDPAEKRTDNESPLEKYPKIVLQKLVCYTPCKIIIIILFIVYLGVSIWGVTQVEQGLVLKNLVSEDSYFYSYTDWYDDNFDNSIIVGFTIKSTKTYSNADTQKLIESMLDKALIDPSVDSAIKFSWLDDYKVSAFYDQSSEATFISGLEQFLTYRPDHVNDVVFDSNKQTITASRFYVLTKHLESSTVQGNFMKRMREIADDSGLPCFAFAPAFIFYEQYVVILTSTLQTAGIALAVMFVVTCVFMPHPLLITLVVLTLIMILVGIFGFMYFWNLTLSSVTMIHLIMSVGFSVDFSAHICHAYISGNEKTRDDRVRGAFNRAGGPIFNAAVSSFVGIIMLTASSSYIFLSFFKLMFLVILFGLAHSVFLLPVILSVIGPEGETDSTPRNTLSVPNNFHSLETGINANVHFQIHYGTRLWLYVISHFENDG